MGLLLHDQLPLSLLEGLESGKPAAPAAWELQLTVSDLTLRSCHAFDCKRVRYLDAVGPVNIVLLRNEEV